MCLLTGKSLSRIKIMNLESLKFSIIWLGKFSRFWIIYCFLYKGNHSFDLHFFSLTTLVFITTKEWEKLPVKQIPLALSQFHNEKAVCDTDTCLIAVLTSWAVNFDKLVLLLLTISVHWWHNGTSDSLNFCNTKNSCFIYNSI